MGSRQYCVVTGRVLDRRTESSGKSPHYQILMQGGSERYRIAINTRSGASRGRRAQLLYFADDDFRHEITDRLAGVADGARDIASRPGGLALDYQRGGMFDRRQMRRIPESLPGPRNDLVDELDYRLDRAMVDPAARLHAFGTRWGPERDVPDQVFRFTPGNGVHDVHMNQGNRDEHAHDNAIWRDGGLIFREPRYHRWCAIFLAFQTQSWHTDEHGDPLPVPSVAHHDRASSAEELIRLVQIVSAFVHPNDRKNGAEHVIIRNGESAALDVENWRLLNEDGDTLTLSGTIPPHRARRFDLPASLPLSASGGLIRLLDPEGAEIDSVAYTWHQAARRHGALTF